MIHTRTRSTITAATRATTGTFWIVPVVAVLAALVLTVQPARAQVAKDVRTSLSPPVAPIQTFIKQQIAKLHGNDPKSVHDAREALIAESVVPDASAAYLATYSRELNTELLALQKDPDLRVRLNGAVAGARVSQNIADKLADVVPPLTTSIIGFINDGSEAVSLWGLKGAKVALPRLVKQGNAQQMMAAVLAAAKKYPANTTIAYEALATDADAKVLQAVIIPAMQDLLAYRVSLYQKAVPPDASAEILAANILVPQKWWVAHSKDQKQRTQQLLLNLGAAAGQRAADPNISNDQREMMALLVKQVGLSFQAIGIHESVPELQQMSRQIVGLSQRAPADQITGAAKAFQETVLKVRPNLTPPGGAPPGGGATNGKPATSKSSGG